MYVSKNDDFNQSVHQYISILSKCWGEDWRSKCHFVLTVGIIVISCKLFKHNKKIQLEK